MTNVYSRCRDFVQRDIAGECLLVPIHRRQADANSIYVLNEMGAVVWRRLDGKLSVSEIIDQLLEEYAVERARLQKDVSVLVEDLLSIKAISAA